MNGEERGETKGEIAEGEVENKGGGEGALSERDGRFLIELPSGKGCQGHGSFHRFTSAFGADSFNLHQGEAKNCAFLCATNKGRATTGFIASQVKTLSWVPEMMPPDGAWRDGGPEACGRFTPYVPPPHHIPSSLGALGNLTRPPDMFLV